MMTSPDSDQPIRVALADSQPLALAGLKATLADQPDIAIIAIAGDGMELLETLRDQAGRVDIVVMDYHLPLANGRDCLEYIRWQRWPVRVMVLSAHMGIEVMRAVVEFGAEALVDKSTPPAQMLSVLRHVASGLIIYPDSVRQWIRPVASPLDRLTDREASILSLVADGLSNPAIARHLVISENTVKTHLKSIFEKLGLSDRQQAAVLHRRYSQE
jgi:DNA-binding NarL/FixJ family response regulator